MQFFLYNIQNTLHAFVALRTKQEPKNSTAAFCGKTVFRLNILSWSGDILSDTLPSREAGY